MNNAIQKIIPSKILQNLIQKSLQSLLIPLEKKSNQEMIDLQYLKESSNQILCNITISYIIKLYKIAKLKGFFLNDSSLSSSTEQQSKPKRKVIFIQKTTSSSSKSPLPSPISSKEQTTKVITTDNHKKVINCSNTKPQTPKSLSQDRGIRKKNKNKIQASNDHLLDQTITLQPTAIKTISPIQRKPIKGKTKIVHKVIMNKKQKDINTNFINKTRSKSKLSNKTIAVSNQSTPSATPRQLTKGDSNKNRQMRKISNYFGKMINKINDDQLIMQEKFSLTDIRLSRIELSLSHCANNALNKNQGLVHSSTSHINSNNPLASNDQLETYWDLICGYFTMREMSSMIVINKSIGLNTINHLLLCLEHEIEALEENISLIRQQRHSNNCNLNIKTIFELRYTTIEALKLLNDPNTIGLFSYTISRNYPPCDTILFIYKLYFVIFQKKVKFDQLFWNNVCEYFTKRPIDKLNVFVENEINKAQITYESIYCLDRMVYSKQSKIFTPEYFKNLCAVTFAFACIIRDILENIGLTIDSHCDNKKSLMVLNAKLEYKNKLIMILNKMNEKYFN